MSTYYDFYKRDDSNIAIEHWCDSCSVAMHTHEYYELFLIEKGSCTHIYNNQKVLLIPGDCFLVPSHHTHGFTIHNRASIFNCQFFPEKLEQNMAQIVNEYGMQDSNSSKVEGTCLSLYQAHINKQGIIHLGPQECVFTMSILNNMLNEQNMQGEYFQILKQKYFEIMLIIVKRASDQQYKNYFVQPKRNQSIIVDVLAFIEVNITNEIDFTDLAKQKNLSPNHFRKLFKDFTGLPPVEYMNRLRITKACEYLLRGSHSMSEIAEQVGIYDSNYFSRLFKQYMGCSPRHYETNSNL